MTKRFAIGFSLGLLIFVAINLLAAHLTSDCGLPAVFGRDAPWHRPPRFATRHRRPCGEQIEVCADDIARVGWPLQFYEEGGFAYHRDFNMAFLLTNLVTGLAVALLTGWLFLRSKKTISK